MEIVSKRKGSFAEELVLALSDYTNTLSCHAPQDTKITVSKELKEGRGRNRLFVYLAISPRVSQLLICQGVSTNPENRA